MREEHLQQIATLAGLPVSLVRHGCIARWLPSFREWRESAPVGEVAVWIQANAKQQR